jgi:hypothetical protein
MTAEKSNSTTLGTVYTDIDPSGNLVKVYGTPGAPFKAISITVGGDTLMLSQSNVTGLLPALIVFANTGAWI